MTDGIAVAAATTPVVVRMYRGLLGDCFLIRIGPPDAQSTILIDCGVLQGTPGAAAKMTAIAQDIRATCHGRLDLVVATHEHTDHLAGFSFARDLFFDPAQIAIGAVWMAWTENPDDQQATALRAKFAHGAALVQKLAAAIKTPAPGSSFAAAQTYTTAGLEDFLGVAADSPAMAGVPAGFGAAMTTRAILDRLKQVVSDPADATKTVPPRYLNPGERVLTPGPVALPVFVLGPPRDPTLLFKALAGASDKNETYLSPFTWNAALLEATVAPDTDGSDGPATHSPFGWNDRQLTAAAVEASSPVDDTSATDNDGLAVDRDWLRQHYYDARGVGTGDDQARRRIDGDWLAAAGEFALKLDSDTNNTSLVLAFQLPGGDYMLFAADAQVGNWESWCRQSYVDGATTLSAADILHRVRLYKVGHHGSHNATLQTDGLEQMTHPALVAMVSTDEAFAKKAPRGWLMPNPNVKAALLAKTQGRLIRGDRRWADDPDVRIFPVSTDFVAALAEGGAGSDLLYVDFTVVPAATEA